MRAHRLPALVSLLAIVASGCTYITRADVTASGTPANAPSRRPSLSADGRWLVLDSPASNLATGDDNGTSDVFLRDNATGAVQLVSRGLGGASGDNASQDATISDDGTTIAFTSAADDLVPGDTNGQLDVFVWHAGVITRVSQTATAQGDGPSYKARVSGNGEWIAYVSEAADLALADNDHLQDVLRWRVSATPHASELVSQSSGTPLGGVSADPAIDDDGNRVAFTTTDPGFHGGPGLHQVMIRDMGLAGGVLAVTSDAADHKAPAISSDGSFALYTSYASNRSDVDAARIGLGCVYGLCTTLTLDQTLLLTQGANGDSWTSGRGDVAGPFGGGIMEITFTTTATSIGPSDPRVDAGADADVVVGYMLAPGTTPQPAGPVYLQAATSPNGVEGDRGSSDGALSADGAYVAFGSGSTNLGGPVGPSSPGIYVRFARADTLAGTLEPAALARGAVDASVIVRGPTLFPGAVVDAGPGVTVASSSLVVDPANPARGVPSFTVSVSPNAAPGPRDVTITYPTTAAGLPTAVWHCAGCLTIT